MAYLKLNFDGASKGNPDQAGFRCVICDHNSNVIRASCKPMGICNAIKAETFSLLMGLRDMQKLGCSSYLVEGDSKVVVGWGRRTIGGSWCLAPLIYEIRELMPLLNGSISY